jgi:HEAT repeat protein
MGDTVIAESRRRIADRRWYVRRNILYILGEGGAAKAIPTIRVLSRDEDPRVRLEAAKCLIKIGSPEGVECLRDLMLKGERKVAEAAVALAGSLKVTEVLPNLIYLSRKRMVSGADYRIKVSVVRALGQIGAPEAITPLRELLSDRSILYSGELEKLKTETRKALQDIEREEK